METAPLKITDLHAKLLDARNDADKFSRLIGQLEDVIRFATKAQEKAKEMKSNLRTLEGMYSDFDRLDWKDEADKEWGSELHKNILDAESQLVDPLKGRDGDASNFNLKVLLEWTTENADFSTFSSPLVKRAWDEEIVEEDARRAARRAAKKAE